MARRFASASGSTRALTVEGLKLRQTVRVPPRNHSSPSALHASGWDRWKVAEDVEKAAAARIIGGPHNVPR
jgi:hypothetical protein